MERQIVGWTGEQELEVPAELRQYIGYPFVQWVNRGDSLMPRQARGGFAAPVDQGIALAGEYAELIHPDGNVTPVIYSDSLAFIPVAKRFGWLLDEAVIPNYVEGARGKLQVLSWVRTEDGPVGPVVLTLRGLAGKAMNSVLREHSKQVKANAAGAEPWFFWANAVAGKPRLAGSKQKSIITPVEYDDSQPLEFIGKDLYSLIVSMADEIASWRNAWKAPSLNGDGEVSEEDELAEP